MRPDLYQAETARIAAMQSALLDSARSAMASGRGLTPLEQSGVLHAIQVLAENAIGKAKQLLKAKGYPVPVSAHDAFSALVTAGVLDGSALQAWNAFVGVRNRIVHDYMNLDIDRILELVAERREQFVVDFLLSEPQ